MISPEAEAIELGEYDLFRYFLVRLVDHGHDAIEGLFGLRLNQFESSWSLVVEQDLTLVLVLQSFREEGTLHEGLAVPFSDVAVFNLDFLFAHYLQAELLELGVASALVPDCLDHHDIAAGLEVLCPYLQVDLVVLRD
eukprot:CAMPEP_0170499968 /NCGR_PEP_ID=MMETSP0208-20121228/33241_1 /TAXON_ID=197538 /ORGANISM="Strombidium inclinatum, Strain S3" /LENGTH=137 /DNA_ID=CAMNT_0010777775 /DNA_START=1104 /DNA_END=1517 /DNA_ORIENTATION=-